MDLSLLAEFEVIVGKRGFRPAAAALGISPSTLSSHIRALEADLGAKLLERTTRRIRLTPAGQALLDETRGSIAQLNRAAELVRRIDRGQAERLRLGHSGSAAAELLQRSLGTLLQRYPTLSCSLRQHPSSELIKQLADDRLDLALVRPPLHHADLNEEHLLDEPLVALIPTQHALACQATVSMADLIRYPFILPPRTIAPTIYDAIVETCRLLTGTMPRITQEAADSSSFRILLSAGAGVALLPSFTVDQLNTSGVVAIPVTDDLPQLPLHVAWRSDNANPILVDLRMNLGVASEQLEAATRRNGVGTGE